MMMTYWSAAIFGSLYAVFVLAPRNDDGSLAQTFHWSHCLPIAFVGMAYKAKPMLQDVFGISQKDQ